jgi:peptide/nickel transport system ATP-binding protein
MGLARGREMVPLGPEDVDRIRSKEIAMVFRGPMTSLNPVYTVGEQITEGRVSARKCWLHLPV